MTYKRFTEIMKEYGYSDKNITGLWGIRPEDDYSDEKSLRNTAKLYASVFKALDVIHEKGDANDNN